MVCSAYDCSGSNSTIAFQSNADEQQYGVTPTPSLADRHKPNLQQPFRSINTPSANEVKGHGNITIVSPTLHEPHSGQDHAKIMPADSRPADSSSSRGDTPPLPHPPSTTARAPTEAASTPQGASDTVNSQPEAAGSSSHSSSHSSSKHLDSLEGHAPPQVHTAYTATNNDNTTSQIHVSHCELESTSAAGPKAEGTAIEPPHAARAGNGSSTAATAPDPIPASGGAPELTPTEDAATSGSAVPSDRVAGEAIDKRVGKEEEGGGKRPAVAVGSGGRRPTLLPSPRTGNSVYDTLIHVSTLKSHTHPQTSQSGRTFIVLCCCMGCAAVHLNSFHTDSSRFSHLSSVGHHMAAALHLQISCGYSFVTLQAA